MLSALSSRLVSSQGKSVRKTRSCGHGVTEASQQCHLGWRAGAPSARPALPRAPQLPALLDHRQFGSFPFCPCWGGHTMRGGAQSSRTGAGSSVRPPPCSQVCLSEDAEVRWYVGPVWHQRLTGGSGEVPGPSCRGSPHLALSGSLRCQEGRDGRGSSLRLFPKAHTAVCLHAAPRPPRANSSEV